MYRIVGLTAAAVLAFPTAATAEVVAGHGRPVIVQRTTGQTALLDGGQPALDERGADPAAPTTPSAPAAPTAVAHAATVAAAAPFGQHLLLARPAGSGPAAASSHSGGAGAVTGTPPLVNHGGPVQHSPRLLVVFWGSNWNATPAATLSNALINEYQSFDNSDFEAILTQYNDGSGPIGLHATFGGSWSDTSLKAPSTVSGASFEAEAAKAITTNNWTVDADTQVVLATPPGTTLGNGFATGACAFHQNHIQSTQASLTFLPDLVGTNWATCANLYGSGDTTRAFLTVAFHEFAESVTDPAAPLLRLAAHRRGRERQGRPEPARPRQRGRNVEHLRASVAGHRGPL